MELLHAHSHSHLPAFLQPPAVPEPDEHAYECSVCHEDCADEVNRCGTSGREKSCHVSTFPCGHKFHTSCILPWLARANTCPTCRHEVEEELNPAAIAPVDDGFPSGDALDSDSKFLEKSLAHETLRSATANTRNLRRPRIIRPFSKHRGCVVGFETGLSLAKKADPDTPSDASYITQVQAVIRGRRARRACKARHCGATRIQACQRGRSVRQFLAAEKEFCECEELSTAHGMAAERLRRSSFGSDCSADSADSDNTCKSSGGESTGSSGFELDMDFSSDAETTSDAQLDDLMDADLATQIAVSATEARHSEVDGRPQPIDGIVTAGARRAPSSFAHQFVCPEIGRVIIAKRVQDPRIKTCVFTDAQIERMTDALRVRKQDGKQEAAEMSDPDDRPSSREESTGSSEGEDDGRPPADLPTSPTSQKVVQLLPMLEIEAQLAMDSTLFGGEKSGAIRIGGGPTKKTGFFSKLVGGRGNAAPKATAHTHAKKGPPTTPTRSEAKRDASAGPGRIEKRKQRGRRVGFEAVPPPRPMAMRTDHQFSPPGAP